jgi:ferredoxin
MSQAKPQSLEPRIVNVYVESWCIHHGICVGECPQVFSLDDGRATVRADARDYFISHAREILTAEAYCPVDAIVVETDPPRHKRPEHQPSQEDQGKSVIELLEEARERIRPQRVMTAPTPAPLRRWFRWSLRTMNSLVRGEPDVVTCWAGPLILGGMLLGFASARFDLPGVITAMIAIGFGASGGSLVHWRYERGLWMLAGLFLLVYAAIYGLFIYGQVGDIVRGARRPAVGLMLDFSLGTMILSGTLRFLSRVAKHNWTFSRESGN